MRFRTEGLGGHNLDGVVHMVLLLLAIAVGGLITLAVALGRCFAGRSYGGLLIIGLIAVAPLVIGAMLFLS